MKTGKPIGKAFNEKKDKSKRREMLIIQKRRKNLS